jgi:hypothetical protein
MWKVKKHGTQTPTSHLALAVRPTDLQFSPAQRRLLLPELSVPLLLTESDILQQL